MTGAAISFERRWTKGDEPKTFVAESKPWLGGEGKREFSSGDRWNLLLPAMLCTSLCPETVVVALPTGRKGLEKEKRKREREKRGSGSIDEIARISTLSPSPSFNSWPSLQMLVSRAHTGKGFLPSSLFFLLLSLSFSPLAEIFSLSLSALDRGGGRIEIFRSHGSLRVKRERARSNLFRRVWIFCSGRWTGLDSGPVASDLVFLFFFCGRKNGVVFGGRGNLLGSVGRNFVKGEVRWKIFPFSFFLFSVL